MSRRHRSAYHRALLPFFISVCLLLQAFSLYAQDTPVQDTVVKDTVVMDNVVVSDTTTFSVVAPAGESDTGTDVSKYFISKYDDRYLKDSLLQRALPDSAGQRLKREDAFWYADKDFRKKQKLPEETKDSYTPLFDRGWFKALIWIVIIGAFVWFLIWYLSSNEFGLFRRGSKAISTAEEGEEEMPENIFDINYNRELEKALSRGDYRMGVRLLYMQLLKRMSEKNVISYKQDKTNFDYLFGLMSSKYYDGFFRLTRNYEYAWYGHFEVSPEHFSVIRNDFEQYHKQHL